MIEDGFINLYTDDLSASLRFYADALGFRETFHAPAEDPDHVELKAGAVMIALSTSDAARTHHHVEPTPGAPVGCLVLWVRDLAAAYASALRGGGTSVREPAASKNGNRGALVRDPSGNLVELVTKA